MLKQFRDLEAGELLVAGYDMATGVRDFCAVQFISKNKADVPVVIHSDRSASEITPFVVSTLERIFDITGIRPIIAPETNSGGVYEIDRMVAMNRFNKFELFEQPEGVGMIKEARPRRYGWTTTYAVRPKMLADLKQAVDNRVLRIYDEATINEMFSFVIIRRNNYEKAQAEAGARDDLIMALAIAYQVYLNTRTPIKQVTTPSNRFVLPKDFGGYDPLGLEGELI